MANRDGQVERIATWIGNPAEHAHAAEAIGAMGEAAIPGLRGYLDRGPQAIPQLRCFAVAMLARLHADAATAALQQVLRGNPLHGLGPPYMESEYVVKCDALEALCTRSYPALADDVAFGLHERLRAAVVAAGRLGLPRFADALVGMLEDDVLAGDAVTALVATGQAAGDALAPRLDAWLIEAQDSARRRLALIRALRVLQRLNVPPNATLHNALRAPHPAVRAAAALQAWPQPRNAAIVKALLRGAIGFDREFADDCRVALRGAGAERIGPAQRALQRNAEPDLYGQMHPLSSEQRAWLAGLLRDTGAP